MTCFQSTWRRRSPAGPNTRIEDDEPYFASVPELPGVWASGKTVEECRKELIEVIEEWIVARLHRGLPIPPMGEHKIGVSAG